MSDEMGLVRYGIVAHDDGSDRVEPVARGQWVRADEAAAAIERLVAERDRLAVELAKSNDERGSMATTAVIAVGQLSDERDKIREERDEAREALRPFSVAAGGLFTRNCNADEVVLYRRAQKGGHAVVSVTAGDFFRAHQALGDT